MPTPQIERVVLCPGQYEVTVAPSGVTGIPFVHLSPTEATRLGQHILENPWTENDEVFGNALLAAAEEPDRCACGGFIAGIGERCDACEGERFEADARWLR